MELEFARYSIDDTQKDLEDVYLKKNIFVFSLIANNLLQECLNLFFKVHRIFKEKPKRLQKDLKLIDKNFERLYSSALIEKNIDKQYKNINKLVNYTEKLIGGKRPREWVLKSKCTTK